MQSLPRHYTEDLTEGEKPLRMTYVSGTEPNRRATDQFGYPWQEDNLAGVHAWNYIDPESAKYSLMCYHEFVDLSSAKRVGN